MDSEYLRYCVYYNGAFDDRFDPLPGFGLTVALELSELESDDWKRTGRKIEQSIRKMLMMWTAGEKALEAEKDFYSTTIQDAPVLVGRHAVEVQYHCEAMIFFARSALDLAAYAFGKLLPPPLAVKRTDSFNDLLKAIVTNSESCRLVELVESWRAAEPAWLPLIADVQKGRSLRDQLAHQMGFPLDYRDISLTTERRSAVVVLNNNEAIPLRELIETLRLGVIRAFTSLENVCETHHRNASTCDGDELPNDEVSS